MILKDKEIKDLKAPTTIAGQKQELDVAFYLRREFKDNPQIFVINDYKFSFNNETAQIDHLIVYPLGFILIESKSIAGEVKVNKQGEWTRSLKSKWSGMASPIKQVELQEKLLKELLHHHRADILGKIFGLKQQSFGLRCWNTLCAVSSNAIIERNSMTSKISDVIVKSEFLVEKIIDVMDLKSAVVRTLNILDNRPAFNEDELTSITKFIMSHAHDSKPQSKNVLPEKTEIILRCKGCGEAKEYTPKRGKFGYYINCNKCNKNTPMKMSCFVCKSKDTKVSKRKSEYMLLCNNCGKNMPLVTNVVNMNIL